VRGYNSVEGILNTTVNLLLPKSEKLPCLSVMLYTVDSIEPVVTAGQRGQSNELL